MLPRSGRLPANISTTASAHPDRLASAEGRLSAKCRPYSTLYCRSRKSFEGRHSRQVNTMATAGATSSLS